MIETIANLDWSLILQGFVVAHLIALVVVNATPTPVDDKWLGRVYKLVETIAGVFGKAKQLPGEDAQIAEEIQDLQERL